MQPRGRPISPTPYDPNRLPKFVPRHAVNGVAAGWVAMLALIRLDPGGLGSRLAASPEENLATALLAFGFGVSFAFPGAAWGVLVALPGLKPEPPRPPRGD